MFEEICHSFFVNLQFRIEHIALFTPLTVNSKTHYFFINLYSASLIHTLLFGYLIINMFFFRRWVSKMSRPFEVRYNPHTQRVEVLDSVEKLDNLMNQLNLEILHLNTAFNKLKDQTQ